jgi:hypothetical protein
MRAARGGAGALAGFYRLAGGVFVCVGLMAAAPIASADGRIAPIESHPHGQNYAEWGARWYQWALGTPAGVKGRPAAALRRHRVRDATNARGPTCVGPRCRSPSAAGAAWAVTLGEA